MRVSFVCVAHTRRVEASFEREMAGKRGHTHTNEGAKEWHL